MDAKKLLEFFTGSGPKCYGERMKIHRMRYEFFMGEIFYSSEKERNFESFVDCLSLLIIQYVNRWMSEYKEDLEKNVRALFDFRSKADFKKVFEAVYADSNFSDQRILMPVSNAMLHLKRYGNGLALRLMSNNGSSDNMHVNGTKILEEICDQVNGSPPGLHEFIRSIECIIPLRKKQGEINSIIVDFHELHANLTVACPYHSWFSKKDFVEAITGPAYTNPSDHKPGALVGKTQKYEFPIVAELMHFERSDSRTSPQWRKGNIENKGDFLYSFSSGDDLQLSLRVDFPFPSSPFSEKVSNECDVLEMQYYLRRTGATLDVQLRAMINNSYHPYL